MTKKILIITVIVLIFVIASIFMVSIFSSKNTDGNGENGSSGDSGGGFIFGLFGGGNDGGGDSEEIIDNGLGIGKERPLLKLRKISETPTAGFISFEDDDEVFIRYTERATGHIYEARTTQPTVKRISNTTIPRIYDAVWVDKDSSVIRYLDDENNIKSFYAGVVKNEEENSEGGNIEGVFLKDNIQNIIVYGEKILSQFNSGQSSRFIVSDIDGSNGFEISESPITEWFAQRPKVGILALTTKPSSHSLGYLYFLNTNTGALRKKLGGITGLTSLVSWDAKNLLYSNKVNLHRYNLSEEEDINLYLQTLPEKCAWSRDNISIYCGIISDTLDGEFPDDWYQGLVTFSDEVYKIDIEEGSLEFVISPLDFSGEKIDMIKPALSPNDDYLFFINKKDLSLWGLDLRENKVKIDENIDLGTTTEEVIQ